MTGPPPFNAGVTGNLLAREIFIPGCPRYPERARRVHRATPGVEPGPSLIGRGQTVQSSYPERAHYGCRMTQRYVIVVTEAIESSTYPFSGGRSSV